MNTGRATALRIGFCGARCDAGRQILCVCCEWCIINTSCSTYSDARNYALGIIIQSLAVLDDLSAVGRCGGIFNNLPLHTNDEGN